MAKTKYDNLLSTDGMPHYNHKGKYYMFLTGASSTVDVYYNGMLEIKLKLDKKYKTFYMNTDIMKTVDIESLFCYISSICSARILTVLRKEL